MKILLFLIASAAMAQTNPACPAATAAPGVTPHCAVITWGVPATGGAATGYNVYRETVSGTCKTSLTAVGCLKLTAAPVTALTFTDNSSATNVLQEGPTYSYVITATNASGESAPSAETSGTFPALLPGVPQNPAATFK